MPGRNSRRGGGGGEGGGKGGGGGRGGSKKGKHPHMAAGVENGHGIVDRKPTPMPPHAATSAPVVTPEAAPPQQDKVKEQRPPEVEPPSPKVRHERHPSIDPTVENGHGLVDRQDTPLPKNFGEGNEVKNDEVKHATIEPNRMDGHGLVHREQTPMVVKGKKVTGTSQEAIALSPIRATSESPVPPVIGDPMAPEEGEEEEEAAPQGEGVLCEGELVALRSSFKGTLRCSDEEAKHVHLDPATKEGHGFCPRQPTPVPPHLASPILSPTVPEGSPRPSTPPPLPRLPYTLPPATTTTIGLTGLLGAYIISRMARWHKERKATAISSAASSSTTSGALQSKL